ncbi:hypothetical protein B0H14DRAFT_3722338 [Mycena olivaceomarginata]|nr:hypothetical protein B0H14DRAFT_3722338 [Mycena olivaceomarginata]
MPYTQNPDRFAALGMYKAPAHLTKEEFEAHMITLTDDLLAVPISKNNFHKFDLIVKDKDFKERIDAAEHFGIHVGSCSFSADLKTRIFIPTSNDRVHAMGVFEVGPQPDKTAFHDLVEELAERILELPAAKKNILKKTLWFQNEQIREDLNELGLPPPKDVVVLMIEAELRKIIHLHLVPIFIYSFVPTQTIENVVEHSVDPFRLRSIVLTSPADFALHDADI